MFYQKNKKCFQLFISFLILGKFFFCFSVDIGDNIFFNCHSSYSGVDRRMSQIFFSPGRFMAFRRANFLWSLTLMSSLTYRHLFSITTSLFWVLFSWSNGMKQVFYLLCPDRSLSGKIFSGPWWSRWSWFTKQNNLVGWDIEYSDCTHYRR